MPADCERNVLLVLVNYADWLRAGQTDFSNGWLCTIPSVVVGHYDGEEFSSGIDRPEDVALLAQDYSGGTWTNRIYKIAPVIRQR